MTEIRMDVDPRRDGSYRVQILAYRGAHIGVLHNGRAVEIDRQPGQPGPFFAQRAQEFLAFVNDTVVISCGGEQCIIRVEKPLPSIEGNLEVEHYFNGLSHEAILENDDELHEILLLKKRELAKK